jgi:hypothetical protein
VLVGPPWHNHRLPAALGALHPRSGDADPGFRNTLRMGNPGPAAGGQGRPARAPGRQDRSLAADSPLCSACRHRDGPQPLGIRAWACQACGVVQDRDANAARNILVAAGLAETQNACGGSVSPGQPLAVAGEAETRRGAA